MCVFPLTRLQAGDHTHNHTHAREPPFEKRAHAQTVLTRSRRQFVKIKLSSIPRGKFSSSDVRTACASCLISDSCGAILGSPARPTNMTRRGLLLPVHVSMRACSLDYSRAH